MRKIIILFFIILILFVFSGCSGNEKVTNEKAQQAITQWLISIGNGAATVTVTGVLEVPQENSAKADITLSNFVWNSPKNDAVTAYVFGPGGASHTYSGRADAIFAHYNDGRWVLTKIVTPNGSWDNLNIVATGEGATSPTGPTATSALSTSSLTSRLIGKWSTEDNQMTIEYLKDNTWIMRAGVEGGSSDLGTWTALDDGRIRLDSPGGQPQTVPVIKIEGNELIIEPGGNKVTFHKVSTVASGHLLASLFEKLKASLGLSRTPSQTVKEFMMAVNDGESANVAKLVSKRFLSSLEQRGLERTISEQSKALKADGGIQSIEVKNETINGTAAKVLVEARRGTKPEKDAFVLFKDTDDWKIDSMSW